MRINHLLFVLALCLVSSGCRLFHNAWRTTITEPVQFSREVYDKLANKRFRDLAVCALDEATSVARAELDNYACEPFSVDYQCGFIDGYVDFLEAGGSGNPAPLPPRRYWKAKYQNPRGYERTQDWFRGFQHGASVAQASNYRSFVTVPLSDSVTAGTIPYAYGRISPIGRTEEPDDGDYVDAGRLPDTVSQTNKEPPHLTKLPERSTTQ